MYNSPVQAKIETLDRAVVELSPVSGFRSFYVDQVDSTMNLALQISRKLTDVNFVITAKEQTHGRGQYSCSWHSPPGNLYVTFTISQSFLFKNACYLLVACAVAESLGDSSIKIKHPNDLYRDGKKVGGVLVEFHGNLTLIGVGVNLGAHPAYATSIQFNQKMLLEIIASNLKLYLEK